jgi:hypothetical protein
VTALPGAPHALDFGMFSGCARVECGRKAAVRGRRGLPRIAPAHTPTHTATHAHGSRRRYVTVDEAAGRSLFYAFAESRTRPHEAPLLLWLNG